MARRKERDRPVSRMGKIQKSEYSISGFFKFWIGRRIVGYFLIIKAFVSVSVDPIATPGVSDSPGSVILQMETRGNGRIFIAFQGDSSMILGHLSISSNSRGNVSHVLRDKNYFLFLGEHLIHI